jgi:hypothetical protein
MERLATAALGTRWSQPDRRDPLPQSNFEQYDLPKKGFSSSREHCALLLKHDIQLNHFSQKDHSSSSSFSFFLGVRFILRPGGMDWCSVHGQ